MFTSRLVIRDLPEPDLWTLAAPLVWSDPVRGTLTAPEGFVTDLASIPRALRNLPTLDVDGISRRPAAMHDWLYGGDRSRGKGFADTFLRDALIAEGASDAVADTYYEAVHLFGAASWASDAPKESTCAV